MFKKGTKLQNAPSNNQQSKLICNTGRHAVLPSLLGQCLSQCWSIIHNKTHARITQNSTVQTTTN